MAEEAAAALAPEAAAAAREAFAAQDGDGLVRPGSPPSLPLGRAPPWHAEATAWRQGR